MHDRQADTIRPQSIQNDSYPRPSKVGQTRRFGKSHEQQAFGDAGIEKMCVRPAAARTSGGLLDVLYRHRRLLGLQRSELAQVRGLHSVRHSPREGLCLRTPQ